MHYEPLLVVRDCSIQGRTELGSGVYAEPLREPLGFRGEVEFLFGLHADLGITSFDRPFMARTMAATASEQPTALIHFPIVEAEDGRAAQESAQESMIRAVSVLSWLSANPVQPIIVAMRRGTEASIRLLPPQWSRLEHFNGYLNAVPAVSRAADNDPRIRLMLEIFRNAMGTAIDFQGEHARGYDSRLLLFGQLLEVACGDLDDPGLWERNENTLANRLRRRSEELGLTERLATLVRDLGVTLPAARDGCDLVADLRNTLAHRGALDLSRYDHVLALAGSRPQVDRELRELSREVIAFAAQRLTAEGQP